MTTRKYSSRSQQSTLTGAITSGATSMTVVSGSGLLGGVTIPNGTTFTLVIDVDTALEEIVDATAVSTNTFTITRGIDGSIAQDHSAGAVVRHMAIGRDYRDANLHAEADASYNDGGGNAHAMHGIAAGEGVVVGTLKTQTLTNKTLTSPTISNPTITGTSGVETSIVFEGSTADAYETTLTVVDPTQDNTITLPNTTGTVTINDATQTLTNKTLTSPTISGSPVITGLSSAGMVASSATPKDYVDAILGSATAAATSAASAATSAASAATSASSAATSASNALTSANSASTSATAAATSAASAATSATAAATSATSAAASATTAANSATAAATSATSAANSATSSASSASAAATSATSASASATASASSASAAATSATSAAASATAAATSASSAATSATAATTSATSAAASATAAATSATSAATSATDAATSAASASTSASSAATSQSAAAGSASDASTSASSSLTSANSAATSASSAATSASSALTSANSAAASYDQFDDRYLGAKSTPPTLDNDGNPLATGAIYFYTVDNNMYAWTGSAWTVFTSASAITSITASSPLTGGGSSSSVTVGIQSASTSQAGAVQLTDSTASTSVTTAATPNSVKQAYDLAASALAGLHFHDPVETATSSNITLSGLSAVNGYTPIAGDRILVKDQTTQADNGIYVADSSTWSRATDFDTWDEVYTSATYVKQGNLAGESFITTVASTGTVGVTAITWALFATDAVYSAGTGLTLVGTTFALDTTSQYVVPSQTGQSGKYLTTNGTTASWETVSAGDVTSSNTVTLTNKTISLGSNTVSGTTAQFNTALTDGDFATLAGSETLTNKTITTPTLTLSSTSSATDARVSWDSTNKKIQVGNGTSAIDFASSTVTTNAQVGSYTLVIGDKDKLVEMNVGSANNLTVPLNSSVAFPTGTQITILQVGAGQTSIVATGGVTINATPGLKLRAQWSSATLIKRGTDTWVAIGDLST
jgi:hypothetical protein